MQAILLLRGISKGESTNVLAAELELTYKIVLTMRHRIHANAVLEQSDSPLSDSHSEIDEMFQNAGGEKVNFTLILLIHPESELTKSEDTAPMRMIVRPSLAQLGGKVGRCAYASFTLQIAKRWKRTSTALLSRKRVATQMSGNHTITSFENTRPFVMPWVSGHEMMMAMVFGKFIRTLPKGCGQMYAIFYAPLRVSTRSISVAM